MKSILPLLKTNWKSGLTVSLVSIPLSIALAIASGATPAQGIITAFWAGLIGAFFGGSHFNIIGPTGALSGILIIFSLSQGFLFLPFVAITAGILILLAYYFHFDRYIIFIPKSVVHGFTFGVAMIIALGQMDNIFGLSGLEKSDKVIENVFLAFKHFSEFNWAIFAIFIIGTIFIFAWNKRFKKLPGAIVLTFIGITASWILKHYGASFELITLADRYPDLRPQLFQNIWFPDFSWSIFFSRQFWIISLATALIGILETLLSGRIAENMTKVKFLRQKEVLGLGLANIASGLCGGIPATAALARTSLNIKSGATNRSSAVLSAFFLAIITLLMLDIFRWLPMVVIASILVYVAISMLEKEHFIYLVENERTAFYLSMFVAIITLVEDPIIGILIGSIIALLIFVQNISRGQTEVLVWQDGKMVNSLLKDDFIKQENITSDMVVYKISGALTYVNMPAHLEAVRKIRENRLVIVALRYAFYIDLDGVDYLKELIEILKRRNDLVVLSGVNPILKERLKKESFYCRKCQENKIFRRTSDAIRKLYLNVNQ